MFNLSEAKMDEEYIIKAISGTREQIIYLQNIGIIEGKEISIIGLGAFTNTLVVQVGNFAYHLNHDAVKRIMVEEKTKVLKKK